MNQFSNKVQQYLNASWEDDAYAHGIQSSETVISAPYLWGTLLEFQKVNEVYLQSDQRNLNNFKDLENKLSEKQKTIRIEYHRKCQMKQEIQGLSEKNKELHKIIEKLNKEIETIKLRPRETSVFNCSLCSQKFNNFSTLLKHNQNDCRFKPEN